MENRLCSIYSILEVVGFSMKFFLDFYSISCSLLYFYIRGFLSFIRNL